MDYNEDFNGHIDYISPPVNQQYFGTCASVALAHLISDTFAIKYNLEPVIFSALWIASTVHTIIKKYEFGISVYTLANYFINNKIGIVLNECYEYNIINNVTTPTEDIYKSFSYDLPKNVKCCFNDLDISVDGISYFNAFDKTLFMSNFWKKTENIVIKKCIRNNYEDLFNIKVYIRTIEQVYPILSSKNYLSHEQIENLQKMLKCAVRNKPVLSVIICTPELEYYIYNNDIDTIKEKVFTQNEPVDYNKYGSHAIEIIGYGSFPVPHWICKNSWIHAPYFNIAFSTFENKDKWIGCDIVNNMYPFSIDVEIDENILKNAIPEYFNPMYPDKGGRPRAYAHEEDLLQYLFDHPNT